MAIISSMNVNVVSTATKASIYALLAVINPNAPRNVARVEIMGDDGQSADVYVGDNNITDTVYFLKLSNGGDIFRDEAENRNAIALNQLFVKTIAAGGSQTIRVRVRVY